jgi:S-adenosylmethionine-diacylglycerol 3-amino-3-carboxypropyl transferase
MTTTSTLSDSLRCAQGWDDAEVLVNAFGAHRGRRFLSACGPGDNALALLLLDPCEVVAADPSRANLACLGLRIAALRSLDHQEFLELMGARPSQRRRTLLALAVRHMSEHDAGFWTALADEVEIHGAAGVGLVERRLRMFRSVALPFAHRRPSVNGLVAPRSLRGRREFHAEQWDTWRWRLAVKMTFTAKSAARMGLAARPTADSHPLGSRLRRDIATAATSQDPSRNPYLSRAITGSYGETLPIAWQAGSYRLLQALPDRVRIVHGRIDQSEALNVPFAGIDLSDTLATLAPREAAEARQRVLSKAVDQARIFQRGPVPERAAGTDRPYRLESALRAFDRTLFLPPLAIEDVDRLPQRRQ